MENKRSYLVSFGDSTKFRVYFDGNRSEFENSNELNEIKKQVFSFLKEKFPTGGYEDVVRLNVADDDGRDYRELDDKGMDELKKEASRQIEVLREGNELTNNAPYDKI